MKCYQRTAALLNITHFRWIVVGIALGIYASAGLYTELKFMELRALPETLFQDFVFYERALDEALQGKDPYANRYIGQAYLYPTPALLVIEIFSHLRSLFLKASIYAVANLTLLLVMIVGVARHYHQPCHKIWYWFVFCLGFSPFFELLHIGQINMITLSGMVLLFLCETSSSTYAGSGLALSIMTKVSPSIFLGYLVFNKRWKILLTAASALLLASGLAIWRYGFAAFRTYPDVFHDLLNSFPLSVHSHSFVSKILFLPQLPQFESMASHLSVETQARLMAFFTFLFEHCQQVHRGLNGYLFLIYLGSGLLMWKGKQAREPFFLVTSFAMVFSSNILWYHHYVFLLLPLLIWMGWQALKPSITIWCFAGLLIMQIDRHLLTYGLLIHFWGHLSILRLLCGQIRQYIADKQSMIRSH